MPSFQFLLLPGDGIGPEVTAEVKRILPWFEKRGIASFACEERLVGGASYDKDRVAVTDSTMELAHAADAVLFGRGSADRNGPTCPMRRAPRRACCGCARTSACLPICAPAICYPALADSSSLKRELVDGLDILIVRELTGGVYFGEPKTIVDLGGGQKRAIDTQVYDTYEIERIARVAFELAKKRGNKVTSAEKHNVMRSGVLWREVVSDIHKREYPDVTLEHQLADACGMQLVRQPKQFDVLVCDNLFGDMLSDIAAMLTGSLGMLPSASLGAPDPKTGKSKAMYEPVHGSAPDIAGKGIANPLAMIGSLAMALRYSCNLGAAADLLDKAMAGVLAKGLRTADIAKPGEKTIGTVEMGSAVLAELDRLSTK